MRFVGALFREHLLPFALVRTLVADLVSHSEKARAFSATVRRDRQ